MFGFNSFAEQPFAAISVAVIPPIIEAPLGGHFGFDEKKRDEQWAKDRKLEAQRKQKLHEAIFGLPPEIRKEISIAPEQTIDIAAQTVITYDAIMVQIETLRKRIEFEQDEEDFETLLELL
jgi:hypothetical protein